MSLDSRFETVKCKSATRPTSANFCRITYPFCDRMGCIEPYCPTVSDSTGCTCCQLVGFLEVEGEKPCMRDQSTSGAHGPHRLRCHTSPSHLRAEVPHIFLTALLTSVPVGFPYGPRERLLHCGKLAISSLAVLQGCRYTAPWQTASKSSLHQCGNKLTVFPHLIPPDSNRMGIER